MTNYYSDFLINLYHVLIGENPTKKCGIIRKNSSKFSQLGEFTFPIEIGMWKSLINSTTIDDKSTSIFDLKCKLNEQELIKISENWRIKIEKCILSKNLASIYLARSVCFDVILKAIVNLKQQYGFSTMEKLKKFHIITDCDDLSVDEIQLTELRVKLTADVLKNAIISHGGFLCSSNDPEEVTISLLVTSSSHRSINNGFTVLCGPVVDSLTSKKITNITSQSFYKKRETDMRLLAEHKYGVRVRSLDCWKDCFSKLGKAAVTFDLLQNKPSSVTKINLNDPTYANSKGAAFILYNCARLAAIQKKYHEEIAKGKVASLPAIDEIDMKFLNQEEEWELVFNYLLYFPVIIENCMEDIERGQINLQHICSFLSGMCSTFSIYYRRVRVLTPSKSHLVPIMHARLYLLACIEQVLHNGLKFLNLEPVSQM